eukprot:6483981-Amphidinium_carterae.1
MIDPLGAAPAIESEELTIQHPPGLDIPRWNFHRNIILYVHSTSKAMAKPNPCKPPHRLTGKQSPPIVAQLDEISVNNLNKGYR